MSRLKSVLASYFSVFMIAALVSSSAFAEDKPLKELTVSQKETVASFVQHMFPATEFLTGATLMALQRVPVVGAFVHDAGVYLLLGAAFDQGADMAQVISEATGTDASIGHAGSAAVLFLAGKWTYRDGAPVSARDWNSIFVRAATTNEFSSGGKALISETSHTTSVKAAWNPALQLWLANIAAVVMTGPMRSTTLELPGFASALHRSAIITASYRTADLAGIGIQSLLGTSESATTFFKSVTLTASGWALIRAGAETAVKRVAGRLELSNPDTSMMNVIGENLVEASFLGIAAGIFPVLEAGVKAKVPVYLGIATSIFPELEPKVKANVPLLSEAAAFGTSTALAFGFWKYAQGHQQNRVIKQAESGVRLGYMIFSLAPRILAGMQYTVTEVARTYGDSISSAYDNAKIFVQNLGSSKKNDEL